MFAELERTSDLVQPGVGTGEQRRMEKIQTAIGFMQATLYHESVSTARKVKRHQQEIEEGPTYGAGMEM
ncbi:unnamed protein product [Boreogadus saida]